VHEIVIEIILETYLCMLTLESVLKVFSPCVYCIEFSRDTIQ
jgi:hypothetical protein